MGLWMFHIIKQVMHWTFNTSILVALLVACQAQEGEPEGDEEQVQGKNRSSGSYNRQQTSYSGIIIDDVLFSEELDNTNQTSLNSESFFLLSISYDEDENESDGQPENAEVKYYDVSALKGKANTDLVATETTLDGNADLAVPFQNYYVVVIDYKKRGKMKTLIALKGQTQKNENRLNVKINRITTIAADIFELLAKDNRVSNLAYSGDISQHTIMKSARIFYKKVKDTIEKKNRLSYYRGDEYRDAVSVYVEELIPSLFLVVDYDEDFESKKIFSALKNTPITPSPFDLDFVIKADQKTTCIIRQNTCRKHPKKIGEFKDYHQGSNTNFARCLRRAHDYHRWCEHEEGEITTAEFKQEGNILVSATSDTPYDGCFIKQSVCNKQPKRTGLFIDNYQQASTNLERCMKRADDYKRWCKNQPNQLTTAYFYEKGLVKKHIDTLTPYSGCYIRQESCVKNSEKTGLFSDNHQNASNDKNRCMQRAMDFHKWCKNSASEVTSAGFYHKGELVMEIDSQTPYTGCFIYQESCEKHPEKIGLFTDNHKNASNDQDRCLRRAADFKRWCGNDADVTTTASFYDEGELIAEIEAEDPYSGCFVEMDECRKHPEKVGLFSDNYQNASEDQERCLMRATDYHRWCHNKEDEIVKAYFYRKKERIASITSAVAYSGCFINLGECPKHREKNSFFSDNHKNASFDQDRCLRRAAEYHRWCGKKPTETVKASFFKSKQLLASIASDMAYSGCYMTLSDCPKHQDKVGFFYDNHKNSSFDQDRCLMRAADYHRWCGSKPAEIVTASFYESKQKLASLTSNVAYSGCYITLTECLRHPDKVGFFNDNHQNASYDQERCMKRASDYHKWCRNTEGRVVKASFYEKKKLLKAITSSSSD